jgi:hypothetical protein
MMKVNYPGCPFNKPSYMSYKHYRRIYGNPTPPPLTRKQVLNIRE